MFAIIATGGKQYRVQVGDTLQVERLHVEPGKPVVFDRVLLTSDGGRVAIGRPYLKDATVHAKVVANGRGERKMVFRYHSKTRYRKRKTHRQGYTELEIVKIG